MNQTKCGHEKQKCLSKIKIRQQIIHFPKNINILVFTHPLV